MSGGVERCAFWLTIGLKKIGRQVRALTDWSFPCREKVQPLLESLCRGVTDQEVPAAIQGLLANSPHTRLAALSALPLLPCLSESEKHLPSPRMHTQTSALKLMLDKF